MQICILLLISLKSISHLADLRMIPLKFANYLLFVVTVFEKPLDFEELVLNKWNFIALTSFFLVLCFLLDA